MQIIYNNALNTQSITGMAKLADYRRKDDFRSASVKKAGDDLCRCRLNRSNRLLFSIYRCKGQSHD